MPTKPNRWSQQQNYVPKGNGDASGEYADNESGSNMHFQSFKKPDNEKNNNGVKIEDKGNGNKPIYSGKEHSKEEISSIVQKAMGLTRKSSNLDNVIAQFEGDNWNKDIKSLVVDTLASGKYKVIAKKKGKGVFKMGYEICFSSEVEKGFINGEVIAHETGHAIDFSYIKDDGKTGTYSKDYVSKKYNKTMLEMVKEELGQEIKNGMVDKIKQDLKDYKEKLYEELKIGELKATYYKYTDEYDKVSDKYIEIREKWFKENSYYDIRDKRYQNRDDYFDGKIKYDEYQANEEKYNKQLSDLRKEVKNYMETNYKDLSDKVNEVAAKKDKAWEEWRKKDDERDTRINARYSDISDMLQAENLSYRFWGGHKDGYFKGANGDKLRATECFAEITGAIGTNKYSLEILQQYIPKTIEIYKEIIGGLNKNGK